MQEGRKALRVRLLGLGALTYPLVSSFTRRENIHLNIQKLDFFVGDVNEQRLHIIVRPVHSEIAFR